jgi:hypothetical protein
MTVQKMQDHVEVRVGRVRFDRRVKLYAKRCQELDHARQFWSRHRRSGGAGPLQGALSKMDIAVEGFGHFRFFE